MIFRHRVTVGEADLDELGHANNIQYLRWLQDAAIAHSSHVGLTFERYVALGGVFVVRRHEVDYLRSALRGDELEVRTHVASVMAAKSERKVRDRATRGRDDHRSCGHALGFRRHDDRGGRCAFRTRSTSRSGSSRGRSAPSLRDDPHVKIAEPRARDDRDARSGGERDGSGLGFDPSAVCGRGEPSAVPPISMRASIARSLRKITKACVEETQRRERFRVRRRGRCVRHRTCHRRCSRSKSRSLGSRGRPRSRYRPCRARRSTCPGATSSSSAAQSAVGDELRGSTADHVVIDRHGPRSAWTEARRDDGKPIRIEREYASGRSRRREALDQLERRRFAVQRRVRERHPVESAEPHRVDRAVIREVRNRSSVAEEHDAVAE